MKEDSSNKFLRKQVSSNRSFDQSQLTIAESINYEKNELNHQNLEEDQVNNNKKRSKFYNRANFILNNNPVFSNNKSKNSLNKLNDSSQSLLYSSNMDSVDVLNNLIESPTKKSFLSTNKKEERRNSFSVNFQVEIESLKREVERLHKEIDRLTKDTKDKDNIIDKLREDMERDTDQKIFQLKKNQEYLIKSNMEDADSYIAQLEIAMKEHVQQLKKDKDMYRDELKELQAQMRLMKRSNIIPQDITTDASIIFKEIEEKKVLTCDMFELLKENRIQDFPLFIADDQDFNTQIKVIKIIQNQNMQSYRAECEKLQGHIEKYLDSKMRSKAPHDMIQIDQIEYHKKNFDDTKSQQNKLIDNIHHRIQDVFKAFGLSPDIDNVVPKLEKKKDTYLWMEQEIERLVQHFGVMKESLETQLDKVKKENVELLDKVLERNSKVQRLETISHNYRVKNEKFTEDLTAAKKQIEMLSKLSKKLEDKLDESLGFDRNNIFLRENTISEEGVSVIVKECVQKAQLKDFVLFTSKSWEKFDKDSNYRDFEEYRIELKDQGHALLLLVYMTNSKGDATKNANDVSILYNKAKFKLIKDLVNQYKL